MVGTWCLRDRVVFSHQKSYFPKDPQGPSNGGVGTCIAGVRVLKIGTFEGSGYLGLFYSNPGLQPKEKHLSIPRGSFVGRYKTYPP